MSSQKSKKSNSNNRTKLLLLIVVLVVVSSIVVVKVANSKRVVAQPSSHVNLFNKPDITIYFDHDITEAEYTSLLEEIRQVEGIKSVNYVSSEQGASKLKKNGENDELITAEIIPATLEVYFVNSSEELDTKIPQLAKSRQHVVEVVRYTDIRGALEVLNKISPTK